MKTSQNAGPVISLGQDVTSMSIKQYVPVDIYEQIQALLPKSYLKAKSLNAIVSLPGIEGARIAPPEFTPRLLDTDYAPGDPRALGPKTLEGLWDWYMKYLLPQSENHIFYLYLDSIGLITTGIGINITTQLEHVKKKKEKGKWVPDVKVTAEKFIHSKTYRTQIIRDIKHYFLNQNEKLHTQCISINSSRDPVMSQLCSRLPPLDSNLFDPLPPKRLFSATDDIDTAIKDALLYLSREVTKSENNHRKYFWYTHYRRSGNISVNDDLLTAISYTEHVKLDYEYMTRLSHGRSIPAGAQLALLDIAYNSGRGVLKSFGLEKTIDWKSHLKPLPKRGGERIYSRNILFLLGQAWEETWGCSTPLRCPIKSPKTPTPQA